MPYRDWNLSDYHVKLVNAEQRRRMLEHRWVESEKAGQDLGETAIFGWIDHHAAEFREWADTLPYRCVECGLCAPGKCREECDKPFHPQRLKYLEENDIPPDE